MIPRPLAPLLPAIAFLLAVACGGTADAPTETAGGGGKPLTIVAGSDITDTIEARPVQALVVEVRDGSGPMAGVPVRFARVNPFEPGSGATAEVSVAAEQSGFFRREVTDTTDATGRALVLVLFGGYVGNAKVAITVPSTGASDTARYVVLPGAPAAVRLGLRDTSVFMGDKFNVRATVADRNGNKLTHVPTFSSLDDRSTVDASGMVTAGSIIGRGRVVARIGAATDTSRLAVFPHVPIAFVDFPIGASQFALATGNIDGTGITRLVELGPTVVLVSASPTTPAGGGDRIAYHTLQLDRGTIWVKDGAAPPRRVLDPAVMYSATDPHFTRDGQYLYFAGAELDTSATGIWRVRPDGTGLERITRTSASLDMHVEPSPSPDGTRIAYSDKRLGRVVVVTLATGATTIVGTDGGMAPEFSPDGTKVAYLSYSSGLVTVNVDGTGWKKVGGGFWGYPVVSWMSDGQWLLVPDAGTIRLHHATTGEVLYVPGSGRMREPTIRP